MIPYGRQDISQADIDAVVDVLRSDWLTQGPAVPAFEAAVAEKCRAPHAVAMSNATAALHLACLALDVGPGDRVWTSPLTFVASANCARYCGASVDFVDIDPGTFNLSIEALSAKLAEAEKTGKLPKVVIPVHFAGLPCDMAAIARLASQYGFAVIEDASHAIGAAYQGQPVGSGEYSDITIFSFHPVKIITTGEGGMALTRNPGLAARLARLRTHGITRQPSEMTEQDPGPWYYEQVELGYNYRMTDVQAALGHSQLARLAEFTRARERLVQRYDQALRDAPLRRQHRPADRRSGHHLYVVSLDHAARRRTVFEALRRAGIGVNVHYIPVHLQPDYRSLGFAPGNFPVAEAYYAGALTLPLYPGLGDEDQDLVIARLQEVLA